MAYKENDETLDDNYHALIKRMMTDVRMKWVWKKLFEYTDDILFPFELIDMINTQLQFPIPTEEEHTRYINVAAQCVKTALGI